MARNHSTVHRAATRSLVDVLDLATPSKWTPVRCSGESNDWWSFLPVPGHSVRWNVDGKEHVCAYYNRWRSPRTPAVDCGPAGSPPPVPNAPPSAGRVANGTAAAVIPSAAVDIGVRHLDELVMVATDTPSPATADAVVRRPVESPAADRCLTRGPSSGSASMLLTAETPAITDASPLRAVRFGDDIFLRIVFDDESATAEPDTVSPPAAIQSTYESDGPTPTFVHGLSEPAVADTSPLRTVRYGDDLLYYIVFDDECVSAIPVPPIKKVSRWKRLKKSLCKRSRSAFIAVGHFFPAGSLSREIYFDLVA